jgi:mitochondrial enoyl-[acyl-carrier protein] reductase / trans-2-enoyl-CoA reductase
VTCTNGWWTTHRIAREEDLQQVPASVPAELASLLTINPPTALLLLRIFAVPSGTSFILQNAGGSDITRLVVQLAPELGVRTVTFVRTREEAERLESLGADVVLMPKEQTASDVARATGNQPVRAAFDGLGDESAARMASCLAPGATVVTYGGMARTGLQIPISTLIYRDIRFVGFMRTRWIDSHGQPAYREVLQTVIDRAAAGGLQVSVDSTFEVADVVHAVARSLERGRRGKVLLHGSAA